MAFNDFPIHDHSIRSPVHDYGWTPVPLSHTKFLLEHPRIHDPKPYQISDFPLPDSPLATQALQHAKASLPPETFNHSMRVFYFGLSIARTQFPILHLPHETYLLACPFHDIGTSPDHLHHTLLSFEYYGGIHALEKLTSYGAPREQAESVAEAVIRHQDIGSEGSITFVASILQFATLLDNLGENREIVHEGTVEAVVGKWPRMGWSRCFAKTIRDENSLKPWAHTSALGVEAFPDGVRNNELMRRFEE